MMLKRIVMLIVLGLIFSSCDLIYYGKIAVYENKYRSELERSAREGTKKDGPGAINNEKYTEGVKEAIQDVIKRPVNKRVEFEGLTFIIPENTRLNLKHGNIVDEKTGYGIAIMFKKESYCAKVFYRKKVRDDKYIVLYYNHRNKDLDAIGQKIIKANGLTNTCK
ncbi:hypothetical protein KST83_12320 [Fusobacterium nucleatum]|uniref:Lipoprotein n=1 Tax=Fusobacterium nucleatum subsp. polymorphum TaxID=76857 RepID=A0A2C6AWM7_FUSNP|nr:hypothetical protein [Fusobacterium polymorphum]PHH96343.1 hypothetical protein CA840_02620 [Fusobacterium polymorphum]